MDGKRLGAVARFLAEKHEGFEVSADQLSELGIFLEPEWDLSGPPWHESWHGDFCALLLLMESPVIPLLKGNWGRDQWHHRVRLGDSWIMADAVNAVTPEMEDRRGQIRAFLDLQTAGKIPRNLQGERSTLFLAALGVDKIDLSIRAPIC